MKTKFEGLRARRQELGLTLADVAQRVGVTADMIRQMEAGVQRGSLLLRQKVGDVLGVPLRYLTTPEEIAEIAELARGVGEGPKPEADGRREGAEK